MLTQGRADDSTDAQAARRSLLRPWHGLIAIPLLLAGLYALLDFHQIFNNDVWNYEYPKLQAVQEALTAGRLPFWNAREGCGTMLFVDTGVALLESSLLLVLSVKDMIVAASLLHVLLGLVFFYLFARQVGLSSRGAVLGAIIWVFNGYHAWYMSDLVIFGIHLFLPLVLLACLRFVGGGGPGWIVLGALAMACQFLHPRPTDYAYDLLIAGCFALYCAWKRPVEGIPAPGVLRRGVRGAGFLAAAVALALLLTMFYMLPFVETLRRSMRFSDVALPTNNLLPVSPAEMLVPNVWGPLLSKSNWADHLRLAWAQTPLHSRGFFGLAAIPLVVLAWRSRNRYRSFFLGLGLAGLLLVFPTGLFELLRRLPLHGGAVEPVRLIVLVMLSAAVLSGMGYDVLFAPPARDGAPDRRPRFLSLRAIALAAAGLLAAIGVIDCIGRQADGYAVAIVLLSALAVAALTLARRGRLNQTAAYWFFVVVLLGTLLLGSFGDKSDGDLRRKEREFLADRPPSAAADYLRQSPQRDLFRVADYDRMFPQTFWARYGLNSVCYYLAAPSGRMLQYFRNLAGDKFWTVSQVRNPQSVFYELASLRYVLYPLDPNAPKPHEKFIPVLKDERAHAILYENPRAFPRLYFVGGCEVIPRDADALAFMKEQGSADPEWFRHNVLLDRQPEGGPLGPGQAGKVLELPQPPNGVRARVQLDQAAILVLTDAYDESWQATVDGRSTPLLRANFMFRAVAVPPGEHVVEFRFVPEQFVRGGYVSLAAAAVLAALCLFRAARRRFTGARPRPAPSTSTPPSGG